MNKLPWILLGMLIMVAPAALAYTSVFTDIDSSDWYHDSVMDLRSRGIIEGYEDETFRPNNNVNRAEVAVMFDRLIATIENGCIYNEIFVMEGSYTQSTGDENVYMGCSNGEIYEDHVDEPAE